MLHHIVSYMEDDCYTTEVRVFHDEAKAREEFETQMENFRWHRGEGRIKYSVPPLDKPTLVSVDLDCIPSSDEDAFVQTNVTLINGVRVEDWMAPDCLPDEDDDELDDELESIIGRKAIYKDRLVQVVSNEGSSGIALLYLVRFMDTWQSRVVADTNFRLIREEN